MLVDENISFVLAETIAGNKGRKEDQVRGVAGGVANGQSRLIIVCILGKG